MASFLPSSADDSSNDNGHPLRVAILGVGMMGREHISYLEFYKTVNVTHICDSNSDSLQRAINMFKDADEPLVHRSEDELYVHVNDIDVLVIATPNHTHTPFLLRWARHSHLSILVEKPVAVSKEQVEMLRSNQKEFAANIWVAMEYRYMPAIKKLRDLLPSLGDPKMITIRENRYPFLVKVDEWNKLPSQTGDTLVEKCCHFFDLFRLLSGKDLNRCNAMVQKGFLYSEYKKTSPEEPIIDSAYVTMELNPRNPPNPVDAASTDTTLGCLELCMFAEGARHQEEIIVTTLEGRVEAYLPENKVFYYRRPDAESWVDRSEPPPKDKLVKEEFICDDIKKVHGFDDSAQIPTHQGYHYSSTSIEWHYFLKTVFDSKKTGKFSAHVTLDDGIKAVEMGISADKAAKA